MCVCVCCVCACVRACMCLYTRFHDNFANSRIQTLLTCRAVMAARVCSFGWVHMCCTTEYGTATIYEKNLERKRRHKAQVHARMYARTHSREHALKLSCGSFASPFPSPPARLNTRARTHTHATNNTHAHATGCDGCILEECSGPGPVIEREYLHTCERLCATKEMRSSMGLVIW